MYKEQSYIAGPGWNIGGFFKICNFNVGKRFWRKAKKLTENGQTILKEFFAYK